MIFLPIRRIIGSLEKYVPTITISLLLGWIISMIICRSNHQKVDGPSYANCEQYGQAGESTHASTIATIAVFNATKAFSRDDVPATTPVPTLLPVKKQKFQISLIIIILSRVDGFDRRDGIRKSWGDGKRLAEVFGDKNVIGPLFFIGKLDSNGFNERLANENATYGDIVHVDSPEEFRRLTHKILEVFRLTAKMYSYEIANWENLYILRADDDTYVNVPLFIKQEYPRLIAKPPVDALYGFIWRDQGVVRNPQSKYYVSFDEYPPTRYPTFCSGMAYLFRAKLLPKILEATNLIKPLPMEDTYFTGVIAEHIGMKHIDIPKVAHLHELNDIDDNKLCSFGAHQERTVMHRLSPRQMEVFNRCILETRAKKMDDYLVRR